MAHLHYTCPAKSLLPQLGHPKYMDFYISNFNSSFFTPLLDSRFSNIVILRPYLSLRVENKILQQFKQYLKIIFQLIRFYDSKTEGKIL